MQNCVNSIGSYNCSCFDFFELDPTDWRKCKGMYVIVMTDFFSLFFSPFFL